MASISDIKLNKNRIAALAELRPDIEVLLTAQYGGNDCMTYVFDAHVDGKIFQGIGPSKKKAKTMACEQVFIHLGMLDETSELIPDRQDDGYIWEDFTSDIIDCNCRLFYDFDALPVEPIVEIDPSALKPLHEIQQEIQIRETAEWLQEVIPDVYSDEKFHMIGKNAVSILSELYPDADYELVRQSNKPSNPCFVYAVYIEREKFVASGVNKKLAKARAAREALKCICGMEFGVAEDGMPIYEGDARIWQAYKKKIEEEAERQIFSESIKNPVTVLHEFYPNVKYSYEDEPSMLENAMIFVCSVEVENQVFKASGLSKKASKSNAAATALEALEADGTLTTLRQRMEERVREKERSRAEKPRDTDDSKKFMSAVAKLSALFPSTTYRLVGESNLKNTVLTAFTMRVTLEDKDYIGVGKTKKAAKQEAAEKALKASNNWDESDERAKKWAAYEHTMSSYTPRTLAHLIRRNEAPVDLMQLIQEEFAMSQQGRRGRKGRSGKRGGGGSLMEMENMEMYIAEMVLALSNYFGWRGGFSNFDQGKFSRGSNLPGGIIPLMGEVEGKSGVVPLLGDVVPLLDEETVQLIKSQVTNETSQQHRVPEVESAPPTKKPRPNIMPPAAPIVRPNIPQQFPNNPQPPGASRMWKNNTNNLVNNGATQMNASMVRGNMWMSSVEKQRPTMLPNLQQINERLNNIINNSWNQQPVEQNTPPQQPVNNQAWNNINNNATNNNQPNSNTPWQNPSQQQWNQQWNNGNWNQWNNGTWNNQAMWNWQVQQQNQQQPVVPQQQQFNGPYTGWQQ